MTNQRTTSTCIDLIITSNPSAIIDHGVLPSLDSRCKHQIIYSQINFHVPPPPKYKRTFWDYKACNLNALKNDLRNIDWTQAFGNLDVNLMVDFFTSNLLNLAKIHIPFKIATISDKDAPWFNNTIKYAIQKNKRLVKKWKSNGKTPEDTIAKNKSQRDLHSFITDAKTKYVENLGKKISDPNTGAKFFWSSYKRLINNKKKHKTYPLC